MTYDAKEISQRSGQPVEFYRFAIGTSTSFWLTSGPRNVTYLGDVYAAEAVRRGAFESKGEAEDGAVEITLPRTHPIASFFVGYSPEPPMEVTIYGQHWNDAEVKERFRGTVASASFQGAELRLRCLTELSALRNPFPRNTCQAQCNWALYSAQCGVTRSLFTVSGLVALVSGDTIQVTAFSGKPDGWLNNGWIERANGERRWVVAHVGAVATLMSPFLGLAAGEPVVGTAGCDRTEAVCDSKFSNSARFLGFPRVPTKNPYVNGLT